MFVKKNILGVSITDASSEQVSEYLFDVIENSKEKHYIVTPNPEIIVYADSHPVFKNILNQASIALCDGIGLAWAAEILGVPLKERITGTDFMENICKESVRKAVSIGLLGAGAGVAEQVANRLKEKYPGINIVFVSEEWGEKAKGIEHSAKSYKKETLSPKHFALSGSIDILFVAFGHPKQEEWIYENLEKLPVKVMMGVGGAFDYLSGNVSRAPLVMRRLGLEWVYRLFRQPWRVKRIVHTALFTFLLLVVKEKFHGNKRLM